MLRAISFLSARVPSFHVAAWTPFACARDRHSLGRCYRSSACAAARAREALLCRIDTSSQPSYCDRAQRCNHGMQRSRFPCSTPFESVCGSHPTWCARACAALCVGCAPGPALHALINGKPLQRCNDSTCSQRNGTAEVEARTIAERWSAKRNASGVGAFGFTTADAVIGMQTAPAPSSRLRTR